MRGRSGEDPDDELRKRLAMFSGCRSSQNCKCRGFRPKCESDAVEDENDLFDTDAEVIGTANNDDKCRRCSHKLKDHFNTSKCNRRQLELLGNMMHDAFYLHKLLKNTEGTDLLQVYWQAFNIIVRGLSKLALPEEGPWAHLPHDQLSVELLLNNYLASIINSCDMPEQITLVEKLMSLFNLWEIPTPTEYKNIVPDVEIGQYRMIYFQWLHNVILPKDCKSMTVRQPVEIFGPRALLYFVDFYLHRQAVDRDITVDYERFRDFLVAVMKWCRGAMDNVSQISLPIPETMPTLRYSKVLTALSIDGSMCISSNGDKSSDPATPTFSSRSKRRKTDKVQRKTADFGAISEDLMLKSLIKIVQQENRMKRENAFDQMGFDAARGESSRREQELNIIEFHLVRNNLDAFQEQYTMAWLAQLVTLFCIQLPKMPQEYISRFVYDKHHTNLAMVKEGRVIGGICFRTFPTQPFIEIVFCAVTGSEQIKGYGTLLMNHLKDVQVNRKCFYLLTFADEFATGYFSKQGFSPKIDLPKSDYHGFIKEYNGATLMGCQLHPQMKYEDFYVVMKNTRDLHRAVADIKNPNQNRQYGGIEHLFRQKGADIIDAADIPGLKHLAKEYVPLEKDDEIDGRMKLILKKLKESKHAWPFLAPVSKEEVPIYYTYIRHPIDLQTMTERLKTRYYVHERLFIADLMRMLSNCYSFNGRETVYYHHGYEMNKLAFTLCSQNFADSDLISHLQDLAPGVPEFS